jgi:hypothetical protein
VKVPALDPSAREVDLYAHRLYATGKTWRHQDAYRSGPGALCIEFGGCRGRLARKGEGHGRSLVRSFCYRSWSTRRGSHIFSAHLLRTNMNAERLHAVAKGIKQGLQETSLLSLLQALAASLSNQVNQPGQPQYQQEVARTLQQLETALAESTIDEFSPTWVQVLEEIGGAGLFGPELAAAIAEIFSRNQITPSIAYTEIQQIITRVSTFSSAVDQLLASFAALEIGAEELPPGECEVGVLVPRQYVDNRLDKFAEELDELNKIFGVFEEVCTGSRPSPTIRAISSSDLTIFLDQAPIVGACIATTIGGIVALYKQLLEIRKLKGELLKQGVQEKALKAIDDDATKKMDDGLVELVKTLMADFATKAEKGRKNELEIELKFAVKKIANRIDRGFNIEVRMTEPAEDAAEAEEPQNAEKIKQHFARISAAAPNMQFLKLEGEPLLSLEEKATPKAAKAT